MQHQAVGVASIAHFSKIKTALGGLCIEAEFFQEKFS